DAMPLGQKPNRLKTPRLHAAPPRASMTSALATYRSRNASTLKRPAILVMAILVMARPFAIHDGGP
ncbi:MAG: hypothetical protein ACLPSW_25840, partial [Roseiarcus sp.]